MQVRAQIWRRYQDREPGWLAEVPLSLLNDHDQSVIDAIRVLRQITTSQLTRLLFSEPGSSPVSRGIRARRKLARLTKMGYINRIERAIGGGYGGSEGYAYAYSQRAENIDRHAVDIAEVYVRLIEAERLGLCEVLQFIPEDQVKHGRVIADAFLSIKVKGQVYDWYLEVDRDKEYKPQLRTKARAYTKAAHASDGYYPRTLYIVSWAVKGRLEGRMATIRDVVSSQEFPEQFEVCTLDQAVGKLCG